MVGIVESQPAIAEALFSRSVVSKDTVCDVLKHCLVSEEATAVILSILESETSTQEQKSSREGRFATGKLPSPASVHATPVAVVSELVSHNLKRSVPSCRTDCYHRVRQNRTRYQRLNSLLSLTPDRWLNLQLTRSLSSCTIQALKLSMYVFCTLSRWRSETAIG